MHLEGSGVGLIEELSQDYSTEIDKSEKLTHDGQ
jgi:hypothetical protein